MALLGSQSKQQGKSKGERWDVASAAGILIAFNIILSRKVDCELLSCPAAPTSFFTKIRLNRVHVDSWDRDSYTLYMCV